MAFTAHIKYRKASATLQYDNGILTGDHPIILETIIEEAEEREGRTIGDEKYAPAGSYLADPLAIYLLIQELYEDVKFFGTIPELPEVEEGHKS